MKSQFVTSEVFVEIHEDMTVPIIIEVDGAFINLTLEEIEKVHEYAKKNLKTN